MMFSSAIDKFKNVTPRMITEYICQLCPQPRKYKTKRNLQKHQIVIHKGLRNTMRYGNMVCHMWPLRAQLSRRVKGWPRTARAGGRFECASS